MNTIDGKIGKFHPEYSWLFITTLGEIYSLKSGKWLKPDKPKNGYLRITVADGPRTKVMKLHRLVAVTYGLVKPGQQINHINGIKDDNRVENLEGCDQAHNNAHAYEMGLRKPLAGEKCPASKLTKDQAIDIIKSHAAGELTTTIAKRHKVARTVVSAVAHGKTWKELDYVRESVEIINRNDFAKTCRRGHTLTPDNVYMSKCNRTGNLYRKCRICMRMNWKKPKKP